MATIAPYLSQGIHAGQQVALKIHEFRWRTVGHGTVSALSDFELKIDGRVELAIYKGDLKIHITLADQDATATSGPCSLQVNSLTDDKATYRVDGSDVTIRTVMGGEKVQVKVSRSKKDNRTACKVSGPFSLTAYIEPTGA